jgi:hypothetical protein
MEGVMRIVIVGEKNGKPVIRWPQYLGLSLALSVIVGGGEGIGYYLLAGAWSHLAAMHGASMGLVVVGVGLISGLRTPPDKLTPVG